MSSIIIVGAGSIGGSVAEALANEPEHEVTVIDRDPDTITRLRARLDARFLVGDAASPALLRRAGCESADILLGVTESDATNLTVSAVSRVINGEDGYCQRIIRIRDQEIAADQQLLDTFGVTVPFDPESAISASIAGAVENPGTNKLVECYGGDVKVAIFDLARDSEWIGKTVSELQAKRGKAGFEVFAVRRGDKYLEDVALTKLAVGDDLMVVARAPALSTAMNLLGVTSETRPRVFIAGGTPIGAALAHRLERSFHVTLIEPDPDRCARLAQKLGSTLILEGDPTDGTLLRAEDIENSKYFCAVTETDEVNIMSAMLAKQLGCPHTAVLANRNAFQQVLRGHGMDMVVSPSEITSNVLQGELQERSYRTSHSVGESGASVTVFTVQPGSLIADRHFNMIDWPANVRPCALVKQDADDGYTGWLRQLMPVARERRPFELHFATTDTYVRADDICIVYVSDKNVDELNKLCDIPSDSF